MKTKSIDGAGAADLLAGAQRALLLTCALALANPSSAFAMCGPAGEAEPPRRAETHRKFSLELEAIVRDLKSKAEVRQYRARSDHDGFVWVVEIVPRIRSDATTREIERYLSEFESMVAWDRGYRTYSKSQPNLSDVSRVACISGACFAAAAYFGIGISGGLMYFLQHTSISQAAQFPAAVGMAAGAVGAGGGIFGLVALPFVLIKKYLRSTTWGSEPFLDREKLVFELSPKLKTALRTTPQSTNKVLFVVGSIDDGNIRREPLLGFIDGQRMLRRNGFQRID